MLELLRQPEIGLVVLIALGAVLDALARRTKHGATSRKTRDADQRSANTTS